MKKTELQKCYGATNHFILTFLQEVLEIATNIHEALVVWA
jgi:hypothetical protein